jgi:hypothetical protein
LNSLDVERFTASGLQRQESLRQAELALQMPSFLSGDEDAEEIFAL